MSMLIYAKIFFKYFDYLLMFSTDLNECQER